MPSLFAESAEIEFDPEPYVPLEDSWVDRRRVWRPSVQSLYDHAEGFPSQFSLTVGGTEVPFCVASDLTSPHKGLIEITGRTVWDASLVLAQYLPKVLPSISSSPSNRAVRVLEVGSGVGVVAATVAKLLAKADPASRSCRTALPQAVVVATDLDPALPTLKATLDVASCACHERAGDGSEACINGCVTAVQQPEGRVYEYLPGHGAPVRGACKGVRVIECCDTSLPACAGSPSEGSTNAVGAGSDAHPKCNAGVVATTAVLRWESAPFLTLPLRVWRTMGVDVDDSAKRCAAGCCASRDARGLFDLVLCSDCLFSDAALTPLARAIRLFLSHGGMGVTSAEHRWPGAAKFTQILAEEGIASQRVSNEMLDPVYRGEDFHVYTHTVTESPPDADEWKASVEDL